MSWFDSLSGSGGGGGATSAQSPTANVGLNQAGANSGGGGFSGSGAGASNTGALVGSVPVTINPINMSSGPAISGFGGDLIFGGTVGAPSSTAGSVINYVLTFSAILAFVALVWTFAKKIG